MDNCMEQLRDFLMSRQAGPMSRTAQLGRLLTACWNEFSGSEAEGMKAEKLSGRMETVQWESPVLTFIIERHGGTVNGSSRAERHMWTLNVETRTASCKIVGHRQLRPMQRKLYVRPMAKEVAQLIIDRQEDERLKWNKDGSVCVQIGKVLPESSAAEQTLTARRKRFRQALDEQLLNAGWQTTKPNFYTLPAT